MKKMHLRNESIFNDSEEQQLCSKFSLRESELKTILAALSYVYEQAAYHTIRPAALPALLSKSGMDEAHATAVARSWEDGAAELVNQLKQTGMRGPSTLVDSQCQLHLVMGESGLSLLQDPSALIEFGLAGPSGEVAENIALEFNHPELYSFFLKLERVQEQLDDLN